VGRTLFLQEHGTLCRKQIKNGWRRAWQCKKCLRDMGGDGINSGPPTDQLAKFLEAATPERTAVTEDRLQRWHAEKGNIVDRREAWFRDHYLYLSSLEWADLRVRVLDRDGTTCVVCSAPATQVHHLTYERWQHEALEDLVSLCNSCHAKEHEAPCPG
jgi:5-methylcytosine-specific restriction endonuclease McrA